jgi:hypothetical protein
MTLNLDIQSLTFFSEENNGWLMVCHCSNGSAIAREAMVSQEKQSARVRMTLLRMGNSEKRKSAVVK